MRQTQYMNSLWSTIVGHRVTVLYRRPVCVTPVTGRYLGSGHFTRDDGVEESKWWTVTLGWAGHWHWPLQGDTQWVAQGVRPHGLARSPRHGRPQPPRQLPRPRPSRPVKMHYWRLNQFEIGTAAGCHQNQRHARWRALSSPRAATKITDFPEVPNKFQRSKLSPSQFSLEHRDGVCGGLVAVCEGRCDRLGSHRL